MNPTIPTKMEKTLKKVAKTSNLTIRFYCHDGWTKEELDACCDKGEVYCAHPSDVHPYWTLDHRQGSRFNPDKLLKKLERIDRRFDDQNVFTDKELIEHFNW